jgi:hypothetical protein
MTTEQRNTYNRIDLNEPLYPEQKSKIIDLLVISGVLAIVVLLAVVGLTTSVGIGGLVLSLLGVVILLSAGSKNQ